MAEPGYSLGAIFQDTGGRSVNPAKAAWASSTTDLLMDTLASQKLKHQQSGSWTSRADEVAREIEGHLAQLKSHFDTLGKAGLRQGEARTKAVTVRKLWKTLPGGNGLPT